MEWLLVLTLWLEYSKSYSMTHTLWDQNIIDISGASNSQYEEAARDVINIWALEINLSAMRSSFHQFRNFHHLFQLDCSCHNISNGCTWQCGYINWSIQTTRWSNEQFKHSKSRQSWAQSNKRSFVEIKRHYWIYYLESFYYTANAYNHKYF